jgi:hypothetical protein
MCFADAGIEPERPKLPHLSPKIPKLPHFLKIKAYNFVGSFRCTRKTMKKADAAYFARKRQEPIV